MKATIYIEIPVGITYSIDPGQKGRFSGPPEDCWPGYPACVEDKAVTTGAVLKAVNEYMETHDVEIDEQLMEIERQKKGADEEDAADRKYQEMKERYNEQ